MSPGLRIIGGEWKGRRIQTAKGDYRPSTGIVRKSLFDILRGELDGSRFLDLFCGTGSVGIEAISQGAAYVCFIEENFTRVSVLSKNLTSLGAQKGTYRVMQDDYYLALNRLKAKGENFDIVYVDPPYEGVSSAKVLADIVASGVLCPDGELIYEAARRGTREVLNTSPPELYPSRQVDHGGTTLLFFRWRTEK